MKKIHEWMSQFDGHDILLFPAIKNHFERETETTWVPDVPVLTHGAILNRMKDRGLGGYLTADKGVMLVAAYDLGAVLCRIFGDGNVHPKGGMGSQYQEYIKSVKRAGH